MRKISQSLVFSLFLELRRVNALATFPPENGSHRRANYFTPVTAVLAATHFKILDVPAVGAPRKFHANLPIMWYTKLSSNPDSRFSTALKY